jgi:hypothetical protein
MKVFNVSPGKGCNSCLEKEIENVVVWLEEAEIGETITIEIKEMSERRYDRMPEFMGP